MSDPEPQPGGQAKQPVKELTGRIGKYDIVRPLGKGAMGMVYLAHDTVLERDVALKVMVAQIADDPELKKRFEREAKAVAKMTHPNVVTVFDLGYHTDGSPYIAMELLKGQDLQKTVRLGSSMSLERKVSIIVQVLAGLAHAHQAGIVHRDIKPANVFINQDGTVKIMDFGVARLTTASMTGTGNIVGTADYMSPEQVKGAHVDGRSDVFSVGCMLYELLAGKRPFHSDNLMAIFYKITHDEPDFDLVPGGAEYDALLPILKRALTKTLEERYQTAYDFAVDLRDYLKVHATSASGAHALENLVDLEPPPSSPPQPLTDVPGSTADSSGATMDLGSSGRAKAPTLQAGGTTYKGARGSPTVLAGGTAARGPAPTVLAGGTVAPTVRAGAERQLPPTVLRPTPRPARREAGPSPVPYVLIGGLTVALLGAGGYIYVTKVRPTPAPPPTQASLPAETLPTTLAAAAPTTVPPTTAPPPTFAAAVGRAASLLRGAQGAFRDGDYDRAVGQAQSALREDPGNADAQKILDNSLAGQRAQARFRAAEAALSRNDFAGASAETDAGRQLAPWDGRGPALLSRIQEAQIRAQQLARQQEETRRRATLVAQVNDLLARADTALQEQKYDAAIALYDEVLRADAQNQRAALGKTSAAGAKALSLAASTSRPGPGGGKVFSTGRTEAQSAETRSTSNAPPGFEETAGVVVRRGTEAAALPGKIHFDVDPDSVKPGDKYTVKIFLLNEGAAPIQVRDMIITTTVNGRKVSGPVPAQVKDVAPRQRAMLLSLPDFWKEDTTSWSMEVVVRTALGESYKNQVTWK